MTRRIDYELQDGDPALLDQIEGAISRAKRQEENHRENLRGVSPGRIFGRPGIERELFESDAKITRLSRKLQLMQRLKAAITEG